MGSIKNYLIAILFSISTLLGYSTYMLTGKLATSRQEVSELTDKAVDAENRVTKVIQSCDASIATIIESQKVIGDLNRLMYKDHSKLDGLPEKLTLPKGQDEKIKNDDSSRLSPDLMQLLDNAYCSGDKDDPYCTSKRDASGM